MGSVRLTSIVRGRRPMSGGWSNRFARSATSVPCDKLPERPGSFAKSFLQPSAGGRLSRLKPPPVRRCLQCRRFELRAGEKFFRASNWKHPFSGDAGVPRADTYSWSASWRLLTSAFHPVRELLSCASSSRRPRLSSGMVPRGPRLRARHMGRSRPHRRKDQLHQIWPRRADPELSPPDGSGSGHRNTRADRAGTPNGWVRVPALLAVRGSSPGP